MRVYVTDDDIRQGVRGSEQWCPLGWAIRRRYVALYQEMPEIEVYPSDEFHDRARLVGKREGFGYTYLLSMAADRFIQDFDEGRTVRPQCFYVQGL